MDFSHHLLIGLDLESVRNPVEVYHCLRSAATNLGDTIAAGRELRQLSRISDNPDLENDGLRLPALINSPTVADSPGQELFNCDCRALSIDEQRRRYLACMNLANKGGREIELAAEKCHGFQADRCAIHWPSSDSQLKVFGSLNRNSVAKRLRIGKRLVRLGEAASGIEPGIEEGQDGFSLALYKLEELTREANQDLATKLSAFAHESAVRLCAIFHRIPTGICGEDERRGESTPLPLVMVRSPVKGSSHWHWARKLRERSRSDDSGIELTDRYQELDVRRLLEEHLKIRASNQVRSIVEFSLELFERLLADSPLFKLTGGGEPGKLLSTQELELYACVECQKLRASIRFGWLTRCLILAFEPVRPALEQQSRLPELSGASERVRADEEAELRYLNLLALIMGQLLRQHFLVPALESWFLLLAGEQRFERTGGSRSRMSIPVSLVETQTGGLLASRPQDEFKQMAEFVVVELAAVCRNLPRVESLLESRLSAEAGHELLCVLQDDVTGEQDDLVTRVLSELGALIDGSCPLNSRRGLDGAQRLAPAGGRVLILEGRQVNIDWPDWEGDNNWVHGHYLLIVELVNKFRCGNLDHLELDSALGSRFGGQLEKDDRLQLLKVSCQQIGLLDLLELQLNCKLKRYYDFGVVQLDCEPLRRSLIKCIQKERLLITRYNSDELLRLMERLRLQFDEIELRIDLESAIEEHLNERWQAKQSQQPLILSGDGEEPLVYLATEESCQSAAETGQPEGKVDGGRGLKADEEAWKEEGENGEEEEELVYALMSANSSSQQLMAMSGSKGIALRANSLAVGGPQERRVAPLIECRLLVSRFEYLSGLLNGDLGALETDLRFCFEGLVFLSELGGAAGEHSLEPVWLELVGELSVRSRELGAILRGSLARLDSARLRLSQLSELRSRVLDKLVLEFHLLMSTLSARRLARQGSQTNRDDSGLNMGQLDYIQETSDWAQKLELRSDFLLRQNALLAKESQLLLKARLQSPSDVHLDQPAPSLPDGRAAVLDRWRPIVNLLATFWQLAEQYETQQVKWLNSDLKRIEFAQIEAVFEDFRAKLNLLRANLTQLSTEPHCRLVIELNLAEMERKFSLYAQQRGPIFRFLTNRHLSASHWQRLDELVGEGAAAAQMCTTLAQFLETRLDQHVSQLEAINREVDVEYQLDRFLRAERAGRKSWLRLQAAGLDDWLAVWRDEELAAAASRFMLDKLTDSGGAPERIGQLAERLVSVHSLVKRYLRLTGALNLDGPALHRGDGGAASGRPAELTLRSCGQLTSAELIKPTMFIEFLRLFTELWIEGQSKLGVKIEQLERDCETVCGHLDEIEGLTGRVRELQEADLKEASAESEQMLVRLERDTMHLELEREILATKEALALERQQEALRIRDECIRQISERAIPAIRAAAKALDCLNERSLRTLRCIRPNPPEPVRLVIEAVCMLRGCAVEAGMSQSLSPMPAALRPERRFDALRGRIREDYWPVASRMLNGTHSSVFLSDLRKVDKKSIPSAVMRLIRRKYLSSSKFDLRLIERVSRECALLARWLVAVDVFDRVISVVRPNYHRYLASERKLAELLAEVGERRRQIDSIRAVLQEMEDSLANKITHKMSLVELLNQCGRQLAQVECSRSELLQKRRDYLAGLDRLRRRRGRLSNRCLLRAARSVYIEAMRVEQRRPLVQLLLLASYGHGHTAPHTRPLLPTVGSLLESLQPLEICSAIPPNQA